LSDPLGPQFQTNLVWTERILHISTSARCGSALAEAIPAGRSLASSPNTVVVGRVRADTKHSSLSDEGQLRKRPNRGYGTPPPAPEQLRLDKAVPWQSWRYAAMHARISFASRLLAMFAEGQPDRARCASWSSLHWDNN
jgi:hypothetical protein